MRHLAVVTAFLALSLSAATPAVDQPRVALLIANVGYRDARLILPPAVVVGAVHLFDVLNGAGFKIYNDAPLFNLTDTEMDTAFKGFAGSIPPHALVVVYYAGHGTARAGSNLLIGVSGDGVRLDALLDKLKDKELTTIVIIDACRSDDNPLSTGMAATPSTPNSLIAFSSQPTRSARPDSIYTDALVRYLREPIRIEAVLQKARNEVLRATGSQDPQEYGSLQQTVYIVRPSGEPAEGQLLMSREDYYVFSNGRKRRVPDASSLDALGFNPALAVRKGADELAKIPDGESYPGVDSNILTSQTCTYYLFWGMKWCLPRGPDPDQTVPSAFRKDGPVRALLPEESAAIAGGDLARLPSDIHFRFAGSDDVYQSDAGSLHAVSPAALNPSRIATLPAFMHARLRILKGDSNQTSGSRVIADPLRHQVFVTRGSGVIAFNLQGKGAGTIDVQPGVPELMVLAETRGWLLVADSTQHVIHIIDAKSHQLLEDIAQSSPAPTLFTGLALSRDEERLYVANQAGETSGTMGSISVFDLTQKPRLRSTIGKVNCPEGMTITPDGDQIYLASQCGGSNDPVFVIDTSTEEVTAIPGFPVGHGVAVSAAWKKVYVSRVDFPMRDAAGTIVRVPAQVSVIDTSRKQLLRSWPADLHSFAVTPDGNYVLAIGGERLVVIDAKSDQVVNEMQFESPPAGLTVAPSNDGKDAVCYVWLPKTPRLFFSGLSELVKGSAH